MTLSELSQQVDPLGRKLQASFDVQPDEVLDVLIQIADAYYASPESQEYAVARFLTKKAIPLLSNETIFWDQQAGAIMFSDRGVVPPNNGLVQRIAEQHDAQRIGRFQYKNITYLIKPEEHKVGIPVENNT